MAEKTKLRKGLIKKGAPHPTKASYKFESSHLKEKEAESVEAKLLESRRVADTDVILIPRQHAVYVKRRRVVRITPKRPRLGR